VDISKIQTQREFLIQTALEAIVLDDKFFGAPETPSQDLFEKNISVNDFDNMSIRISMYGLLNNGDNDLSSEGEAFQKKYRDTFDISYEGGCLYIQHKDFATSSSISISSYSSDLEGLLYDLKDSDYEGNLNEINKIEEEIALLERILDPTIEFPALKEEEPHPLMELVFELIDSNERFEKQQNSLDKEKWVRNRH